MSRAFLKHSARLLACACLLACAGANAADTPQPDAAKMWQDFLAHAKREQLGEAMATVMAVGYDGQAVDAEQCRAQAKRLADAVSAVPVSLTVRSAAQLCAVARNDEDAAARESAAMSALARLALAQASDPEIGRPIPIVWASDAYTLFRTLELPVRYQYYRRLTPDQHLPLVLVGREEAGKLERHFAFDYVDVHYQLSREHQYAGYPVLRWLLANEMLGAGAAAGHGAAVDARNARSAHVANTDAERLAFLRTATNQGGVQSAFSWVRLCAAAKDRATYCEGLVDALLAQAEGGQGVPLVALAMAYHEGLDIQADPATAFQLLDRAEKSWPAATAEFAARWTELHPGQPWPASVDERMQAAAARGSRSAKRLLVVHALDQAQPLSQVQRAFLAQAAENERGWGYARLAQEAALREEKDKGKDNDKHTAEFWDWTLKAAQAGEALAQATYASALIYGDQPDVKADLDAGLRMAGLAAHGGNAWAARQRAFRRDDQGDFAGEEGWLLAAAYNGDVDASFQLAGLYASESPGVSQKADRAVEVYQTLARMTDHGARARRGLARMAVAGRGMEKDPARARAWLKDDAAAGDTESQTQLGYYYLDGLGGKPDEREGRRWLERAIKAGDEDAVDTLANWLYHHGTGKDARRESMELFARAYADGNKSVLNQYAWALCTSSDAQVFDAPRGMEVALKMGNPALLDPAEQDTVAACHAANGEFARAVELQEQASRNLAKIDDERERERDASEPGHVRRLALYRAGKRYEEDPANPNE